MTWPPPSFLFIVNELPVNDNPDIAGGIHPRMVNGRYHPPDVIRGFFPQEPGYVFRWRDGTVTAAHGYTWTAQQFGNPVYTNGTIYATDSTGGTVWPEYYRAATVFYCNDFDKFFTAQGDASTRNMADPLRGPEDYWHPLSFIHRNNISHVEHAGDQEYLAVRHASWIEQLLPNIFRRRSTDGPGSGGLAGLLPIIIALVAFSCADRDELYRILVDDRAWRSHRWVPHRRPTGRVERRGMVVTVFCDPENPQGSTRETIASLEYGPRPIFQ